MQSFKFLVEGQSRTITLHELVIAGWAGRDATAVEHHIAELEAIGVKRPRNIPCFYRVGVNLLTAEENIEVCGADSSGEAEVVLYCADNQTFVGVGSDHTDRRVEAYGVTVSKQMCPKPIGEELWRLEDVRAHWDSLILRSWATRDGNRILYQEGTVAGLRPPWALMQSFNEPGKTQASGTAMFCGTLPVLGQIGASERFEIELEDPVRARRLVHAYSSRTLAYSD